MKSAAEISGRNLVLVTLVSLFVVGIFFVFFGATWTPEQVKALEISWSCQKQEKVAECLSVESIQYLTDKEDKTGKLLDAFWKLEKQGKIQSDPRIFSDVIHQVGMALIGNHIPLATAMQYCGQAFNSGCVHGTVMQYIDDNYKKSPGVQIWFDLCLKNSSDNEVYLNCLHGIGHEIAAKEYTNDLNKTLHLCDSLETETQQGACTSGVLMEYSKGTAGSGFHTHKPVGTKELPCGNVDEKFKPVCYASAGFYRQFETTAEPFAKSYDYCFAAPQQYSNFCISELQKRTWFVAVEDPKKLGTICSDIADPTLQRTCLASEPRSFTRPFEL